MAIVTTIPNDRIIIREPVYPVEPTGCPTCLSGTPPRDPWFEEAIEPARATS